MQLVFVTTDLEKGQLLSMYITAKSGTEKAPMMRSATAREKRK